MKRMFRSLSKRSVIEEEKAENVQQGSSIGDQTWSFNRIKEDEAADESTALRKSGRITSPELVQDTMAKGSRAKKPSLATRLYQEHTYQGEQAPSNPWRQERSLTSSATRGLDRSIYAPAPAVFSPQYGLETSEAEGKDKIDLSYQDDLVEQVAMLNFYEDMMRNAATDTRRAISGKTNTFLGGALTRSLAAAGLKGYSVPLMSGGRQEVTSTGTFEYTNRREFWKDVEGVSSQVSTETGTSSSTAIQDPHTNIPTTSISTPSPSISPNIPTSCIICIEPFTSHGLSPPPYITPLCTHNPSICLPCLQTYITTSLNQKHHTQLTCPECRLPLSYTDIKMLSTPSTFARYDELSFLGALSENKDYVSCINEGCQYGQIHEGGNEQPIVRCEMCGFRRCFRCGVKWHDRLTCEEFEEMLRDPRGFKSRLEREEEEIMERERMEVVEAERRVQEERRRKEEQERAKQREEIWKRQREEEASLVTVEKTTKKCPGCTWPIEKNDGCSHMTCTKCHHQFCFNCLKKWSTHRGC